jgi:hypothetical protein
LEGWQVTSYIYNTLTSTKQKQKYSVALNTHVNSTDWSIAVAGEVWQFLRVEGVAWPLISVF